MRMVAQDKLFASLCAMFSEMINRQREDFCAKRCVRRVFCLVEQHENVSRRKSIWRSPKRNFAVEVNLVEDNRVSHCGDALSDHRAAGARKMMDRADMIFDGGSKDSATFRCERNSSSNFFQSFAIKLSLFD